MLNHYSQNIYSQHMVGWMDSICQVASFRVLALSNATSTESVPSAGKGTQPGGLLEFLFGNPLGFMMIALALFFLMVIRPQQKAAKAQQQQLADSLKNLKKNDRVVTIGGIHAVVVNAGQDSETVTLRIDENSNATLTVGREAIARVVQPKPKES